MQVGRELHVYQLPTDFSDAKSVTAKTKHKINSRMYTSDACLNLCNGPLLHQSAPRVESFSCSQLNCELTFLWIYTSDAFLNLFDGPLLHKCAPGGESLQDFSDANNLASKPSIKLLNILRTKMQARKTTFTGVLRTATYSATECATAAWTAAYAAPHAATHAATHTAAHSVRYPVL